VRHASTAGSVTSDNVLCHSPSFELREGGPLEPGITGTVGRCDLVAQAVTFDGALVIPPKVLSHKTC